MRVENELGYILHQKPYSETSVLVDIFTPTYGRIGLIAKGAKRPKSPFRAYLFPFTLLSISFVGKSELKTLTNVEDKIKYHIHYYNNTHGRQLICGLYLNELVLRFLKKDDPHPELFSTFHLAMRYLFNADDLSIKYSLSQNYFNQIILRALELKLLRSVGYGIQLKTVAYTHQDIIAADYYDYDPIVGFTQSGMPFNMMPGIISGEILILLSNLDLNHLECFLTNLVKFLRNSKHTLVIFLAWAKKIVKQSLDYHLGDKKIYTRELIRVK